MARVNHYHISNTGSNSSSGSARLNYAMPNAAIYDSYDYLCKLLVIGDSGCGKSSLLKRFTDDEFQTGYSSTIGVDFEVRTIDVGAKKIKLQMWDTAGQERFRTITASYYRGSHAVLVVFDVTSEESFANVRRWLAEVSEAQKHSTLPVQPQILLLANKCDLVRQRVVETHRVEELAQELGIPYLETSAKTNTNVAEAFQAIGSAFLRQRLQYEQKHGLIKEDQYGGGVSIEDGGDEGRFKKCMGACAIM